MGAYINDTDVKSRLLGKVKFGSDDTDENLIGPTLLGQLIEESEAEVELRLSVRYEVPFVTDDDAAFTSLPTTTKIQIQKLVRGEAVKRILDMDFGRGTAIEGQNYHIKLLEDYEASLTRLIELRPNSHNMFKYPPLPSLKLAAHNSEADDGYNGQIIITSEGDYGANAVDQLSNPTVTFWNDSNERNY